MRFFPIAAAVSAALVLSGCAGGTDPGDSPDTTGDGPIRIGMAVSLSGPTADTGEKLLAGVQHWIDQGGTLLGRDVELVVQDDESTPATAARLYERLITVEKVDLVLGPYGSGPSAATAPVVDRHGRFIIMPGASAAQIFTDSEMPVQLMTPQRHLPALPLRLANEQGYKTIAIAGVANPYGTETMLGATNYAEEYGLDVVLSEQYEEESRDLSSLIVKMKSLNPDVVYVGAYVPDAILFMRQAKDQGLEPRMFILGSTGPVVPEFVESLGQTAEYVMGTAQWSPDLTYPGVEEFLASWEKAHPDIQADYVQAAGYGMMQLLDQLTEEAGSLDDEALKDAAYAKPHETIFGPFELDNDGIQIAERGAVTQIINGEIRAVYPKSAIKPELPVPAWAARN